MPTAKKPNCAGENRPPNFWFIALRRLLIWEITCFNKLLICLMSFPIYDMPVAFPFFCLEFYLLDTLFYTTSILVVNRSIDLVMKAE